MSSERRGVRTLEAGDPSQREREVCVPSASVCTVDAILNQKDINDRAKSEAEKLYCVYVAIGQKRSTVVGIN